MKSKYDVAIVGGAGHVGIPLSLALADSGLRTLIYDLNKAALEKLKAGHLPFIEEGGEALLRKATSRRRERLDLPRNLRICAACLSSS